MLLVTLCGVRMGTWGLLDEAILGELQPDEREEKAFISRLTLIRRRRASRRRGREAVRTPFTHLRELRT